MFALSQVDNLLSSELSEAARETGSLWDINKLVSSANKIRSTSVDTLFKSLIYIEQEKQGAQNTSLGDTTAHSLRRGALTVKLNELQPVGEVASNPVQSQATNTIVFEFVKQNIMIDGIKGLRKIKEKRQRHVHCDQEQGRFFHIGQSMLMKLNDFSWSQIDHHIEFLVYLNNYKDGYKQPFQET